MEEEEYRPLRRGRRVDNSLPENGYEDPYLRDENGRPVDFLRKGQGQRPRRNVSEPSLRRYAIIGGVFAAALAISGEVLAAALVAVSTFVVVMAVRWRR